MFKKPPLLHLCNALHLIRHSQTDKQTLGTFFCLDKYLVTHYLGNTLELPVIDNNMNVSNIPSGTYECVSHISDAYGRCIKVKNVANRSSILIHVGNYVRQTRGCILVGDRFRDIDNDGLVDVANSLKTMYTLWYTMSKHFTLTIH